MIVPESYAIVCGHGTANSKLNSLDRALINAGIGNLNLVKVSSILPPAVKYHDQHNIHTGAITFTAMALLTSNTSGELISAAVAVAIPQNSIEPGVLMEGCYNNSKNYAEQSVIEMADIAMQDRNIEVLEIKSIAVECLVVDFSSVIAAVILW